MLNFRNEIFLHVSQMRVVKYFEEKLQVILFYFDISYIYVPEILYKYEVKT